MILTPHLIIGAAIGAKTHNLGLIIILGILSHYILDFVPHWDYINHGIKNFHKTKDFKALFLDLFKIAIDGLIGLLIVLLVVWRKDLLNLNNLIFIILGIFFSILPDILLFAAIIFRGTLTQKYVDFHHKFLHCPKDKEKEGKITFLNISTEILVTIISAIILFS
jgi:hypothetical protein